MARMDKEKQAPAGVDEPLWEIADVAAYLTCAEVTVRTKMRTAGLPFEKSGRLVRFRKSAIDQWLAEQTAAHRENAA